MHFKVQTEKYLSDTLTPVSVYMKIRKKFTEVLLLESADYRGSENSLSFICFSPLAKFKVEDNKQEVILPGEKNSLEEIVDRGAVLSRLQNFFQELSLEQDNDLPNGFFGYCTYEAVKYFEDIELAAPPSKERQVPEICYAFYEFLIIFNHYKNEIHIIHNQSINSACSRTLEEIKDIIFHSEFSFSEFCTVEEESSNLTDQDTLRVIEKCKSHIARGDVFQIVVSRRFMQKYKGDDFNVYRTLRSINPSPYLFYFDYLDYRIFGSSPEAQLTVKDSVASIYPIAGTYPRRADRANDRELATELQSDPKENAEHIMLVDLARNDLNKHCKNVRVEVFKEVQFYSHVIHLVSKVSGELESMKNSFAVLADTFPAGTLSGAPKYKAMQLIDRYENQRRGIYGGCVGFVSAKGDINHAIIIRSFLSKDNVLYYQAGCGLVFDSKPEAEVQEVKNKLGALKQAVLEANKLFSEESK